MTVMDAFFFRGVQLFINVRLITFFIGLPAAVLLSKWELQMRLIFRGKAALATINTESPSCLFTSNMNLHLLICLPFRLRRNQEGVRVSDGNGKPRNIEDST